MNLYDGEEQWVRLLKVLGGTSQQVEAISRTLHCFHMLTPATVSNLLTLLSEHVKTAADTGHVLCTMLERILDHEENAAANGDGDTEGEGKKGGGKGGPPIH